MLLEQIDSQCLKITEKVSFNITKQSNRSNSVTRQVNFNWTLIREKCHKLINLSNYHFNMILIYHFLNFPAKNEHQKLSAILGFWNTEKLSQVCISVSRVKYYVGMYHRKAENINLRRFVATNASNNGLGWKLARHKS